MSTLCTVGHGTRSAEELGAVLRAHDVVHLVDIRTVPRSRRNPQFNADVLGGMLAPLGVTCSRIAALGGLRGKAKDPPADNSGWDNASFRNYADHACTPEFREGLDELLALSAAVAGRGHRVAIMCAETVWWRCHRRIVADHLLARGVRVLHLFSVSNSEPAKLTPFAEVRGAAVTYPAADAPSHRSRLQAVDGGARAVEGDVMLRRRTR